MFNLYPYDEKDYEIVKLKNVLRLKQSDVIKADIKHVKNYIMKIVLKNK